MAGTAQDDVLARQMGNGLLDKGSCDIATAPSISPFLSGKTEGRVGACLAF